MLVQNLAITYKCYSSIGNSLDLKTMMSQCLKTFVSETYAIYAEYSIKNENNLLEKVAHFGKIDHFNPNDYAHNQEKIKMIYEDNRKILILNLEFGSIFMITKNMIDDSSFFVSMFESFLHKLNTSIEACLNMQKLKESNRILEDQQNELKRANKAKDDFLANMSHELKTPLNSINVISSVMKKNKDGKLDDKQVKNLEIINSCGNYLLTLINDVLDISKLEAGKINVSYSKVNLKETLTEVYDMFLPQVNEKNSKLFFNYDDKIEFIYSDSYKIKQIIKNLLSNALKFVGKGSIYLEVKDEDKYLTISVKDEGIGIAEDKLNHIFDRFKQADSSTTRKYGGTGLGLAICRELLDLLEGTIYVKSAVGVGTTFYITIPKNLEQLAHMDIIDIKNDDSQEKEKLTPSILEKSSKPKIMVYNTNALEFFKLVIKLQENFDVIQAFNKIELFKLANNEIKNIIIDIDSIDQNELEEIINILGNKLIIITNDSNLKFSQELGVTIIHKNEISTISEKIKGKDGK